MSFLDERRMIIRNTAEVFSVGKTKMRITTDGCVYCGAEYASDWFDADIVAIGIRGKVKQFQARCCADCYRPDEQAKLF